MKRALSPTPRPWLSATLLPLLPLLSLSTNAWSSIPQTGHDYISLQIVSGDRQALEKHYQKHQSLPYLRIEKRGGLHVLRAGFWQNEQEARAALRGQPQEHGLFRIAAFRPESIVQRNWEGDNALEPKPNTAQDRVQQTSTNPPAPLAPLASAASAASQPPVVRNSAPLNPAHNVPQAALPPANLREKVQQTAQNLSQNQPTTSAIVPLGPFNHEDYTLAYGVMLASNNQQQAFLIAQKAVASVPDDREWRRKLAQVSEWTQHSKIAWENWKYLFDHGERNAPIIQALLRLSSLADNPEIILSIWIARAEQQTPSETDFNEIAELYEDSGKPREGSFYFEKQYRKWKTPLLLEHAARLAENAGDDARAIQLYVERTQLKSFSLNTCLRAAILLLRTDQAHAAHTLLMVNREYAPPDASEFWQLLGRISWELSELQSAEEAYRHQTTRQNATPDDWSRLIFLVRQHHPEQAADLALDAYRRFDNPDYLLMALGIHSERFDYAAQARIFKSLTPVQLKALQSSTQYAQFLVARARYRQTRNELELAWADLSLAFQQNQKNADIGASALWFLIDTQEMKPLRELLIRLAPQAETEPLYWLPFAAAHHALDRYREAAYWYRKEIRSKPDDMLLLLNYADALDRQQQSGMAERIRRHAWIQLRTRYPQADFTPPLASRPDLLAFARLALQNQPGDPSLALVRKVANRLRGFTEEKPDKNSTDLGDEQATNDLILGWSINKETFPNARAWLWLRYAKQLARKTNTEGRSFEHRLQAKRSLAPLWGDSQTALQLNETETMAALLDKNAEGLPIYNRYDTAYALEHWPQALDIAFRGIESNEVDEDLYDRYRIHAPQHSNYVQLGLSNERLGLLTESTRSLEARLVAERKLHVLLGWDTTQPSTHDRSLTPLLKRSEQLSSLGLRWFNNRSSTTFGLFNRNELANNTGWHLQHTWSATRDLALDAEIRQHASSSDSLPLRLAGQEDSLRLSLSYTLGKREDIRIIPRWMVYRSQFGETLGHGKSLEISAAYRFRTEYPDWRARAFLNRQLITADGTLSAQTTAHLAPDIQTAIAAGTLEGTQYFLPTSNRNAGLCLSMGENIAGQNLQESYSRAWRPFFDTCRTTSQLNGAGYSAMLGVAGSITGEDHLRVQIEQNMGGSGSAGAPADGSLTRKFSVRYRHYF